MFLDFKFSLIVKIAILYVCVALLNYYSALSEEPPKKKDLNKLFLQKRHASQFLKLSTGTEKLYFSSILINSN